MKHIVIVGGSYGGIGTAHRILKREIKAGKSFKITLVAPNTHHYWNMASPRAVIPGLLTDEQLFRPIAPGFSEYPKDRFEFILGAAERIGFEDRKLFVRRESGLQTVDYDFLILATGSHMSANTPFKMLDSTPATKAVLHDLQTRVKKAESIIVAGAGVSGVEIAAELGEMYKRQKEITLVSAKIEAYELCVVWLTKTRSQVGQKFLNMHPPVYQMQQRVGLQKLNVTVKLGARISKTVQLADGRQELNLSTGETLSADLYIPAFGLIPNSSYILAEYLNDKGFVKVDEYLRIKGLRNVWAIGDLADIEPPQYKVTDTQSAQLAKTMVLIMSNKDPVPYKVAARK